MYDTPALREQFPILQTTVQGKPLIYLDSAATSQKPREVIESMNRYYYESNANVHRGIHTLSERATQAYEGVRKKVVRFINASSVREIIYTRNTTEGINLLANTWGRATLTSKDAVLITGMEHHSNIVPWQILQQQLGFELRHVPVTDGGELDLDALPRLLDSKVKLFSFVHVSNVLGTINPVEMLVRQAHEVGALVHIDGAQSVPHMPVDVQALGCDFLSFSSHKMCGPTGFGIFWGRRELLQEMPPFFGGGDMISVVSLEQGSTWAELPHKFEAGTPSIAEAIGLGAAIDFLSELGMDNVRQHEIELTTYAMEALSEVPGIRFLGPLDPHKKGGVATFTLEGVHPHDIAATLDEQGIAIRAGHHCAQPLHERFGIPASARASFYLYNEPSEVDALVVGLRKAQALYAL
ncbi:MAG: cysteine desulfurase [Ardenticatenales bacterium]|nr:cysteine desulfurase [Ardenticatenales bacterium]